jgi:hypothetical protein
MPKHFALSNGDNKIFQLLIEKGADSRQIRRNAFARHVCHGPTRPRERTRWLVKKGCRQTQISSLAPSSRKRKSESCVNVN